MSDTEFKTGDAYAVSTGKFLGEFFVYIEQKNKLYCFLSIPKMVNRTIEHDKIEHALKSGILEYQENLPDYVKDMCVKQYKKNCK